MTKMLLNIRYTIILCTTMRDKGRASLVAQMANMCAIWETRV